MPGLMSALLDQAAETGRRALRLFGMHNAVNL